MININGVATRGTRPPSKAMEEREEQKDSRKGELGKRKRGNPSSPSPPNYEFAFHSLTYTIATPPLPLMPACAAYIKTEKSFLSD